MSKLYNNDNLLYDLKPADDYQAGLYSIISPAQLPLDDALSLERLTPSNTVQFLNLYHYHLILGTQGHASVVVNNMLYDVTVGTILLLPPGYLPKFSERSADFSGFKLIFNDALLETGLVRQAHISDLLQQRDKTVPVCELSPDRFLTIRELFIKLEQEFAAKKEFHAEMAQLLFVELMLQGYRFCTEQPARDTHEPRAKQLTKQFTVLVDTHFLTVRTVQEYADKLFVSAKYLSEVIKTETGISPLHHIHQRLFREAQHWLASAKLSVKEVSEKLGFDTPSHFSRFFKQHTGHNPSTYANINWQTEFQAEGI